MAHLLDKIGELKAYCDKKKKVMSLTEEQQYAIRSLSSVITAATPPCSASRVARYANCASASYGATTNSTSSDLKI
jgi:hypothetical protein